MVSPNGRVLHGVINCGGALHVVTQTAEQVTIRLHVGALGAGSMSCARVDVAAHLASSLDGRPVFDAVTGKRLPTMGGP